MPVDYATIQGAIDAAAPGSVVVLADGVYSGPGNTGLSLRGKGLRTLRSSVRGDQLVRVFVETPTKLTKRQRELLEAFAEECDTEISPVTKGFLEKLRDLFE